MKINKSIVSIIAFAFICLSVYSIKITDYIKVLAKEKETTEIENMIIIDHVLELSKKEKTEIINVNNLENVELRKNTAITSNLNNYNQFQIFVNSYDLNLGISSHDFYTIFHEAGIDPNFALATFILETGWGKSNVWQNSNNPAGIKCGKIYCNYNSKKDGHIAMKNLLSAYVENGLLTIYDVRSVWSEAIDHDDILIIMNKIK